MMIRLNFDQILIAGSIGFAAFSVTPPFPLLSVVDNPTVEHRVKQSTSNHVRSDIQQESNERALGLGYERTAKVESIISPTRSQDETLMLAYPPALAAFIQSSPRPEGIVPSPASEEKIIAHEQSEDVSVTSSPIQAEVPNTFAEPLLAIPGSISVSKEKKPELKVSQQSTQNVAPSLLNETKKQKNDVLKIETIEKQPQEVAEEPPAKEPVVGNAQRLEVQSIGIDIAVLPGAYDAITQSWTVDDSSAFHANTTVPVNDTNGTTLIYGHARWGIFGALPDVQPGAEAVVYSADGLRFIYTLESVRQVDPTDVSMLTAEGEPTLLLQTCSGLFDQHRTVAAFKLKEII